MQGPERSAQRNFGARMALGKYFLFLDCDMAPDPYVIEACLKALEGENQDGVVIPEESCGLGFWAKCKKLEKSFYIGVEWMEAARFFRREAFFRAGGYDESLVSGEDWDLSQRIAALGGLARTGQRIFHNEGRTSPLRSARKKYYYARHFNAYSKKGIDPGVLRKQGSAIARLGLYFSHPLRLFRNPAVGLGLLFMKGVEGAYAWVGFWQSRKQNTRKQIDIFILSHSNTLTGAVDRLEEYLSSQGKRIIKFAQPLESYAGSSSVLSESGCGKESFARRQAGVLNYLQDILLALRKIRKYDFPVFIGANNFDTCIGLLARLLRGKNSFEVVYFASDYAETRFTNRTANGAYRLCEQAALKHSDLVVSNTQRAEEARLRKGLGQDRSLVVPNGAYIANPAFPGKAIKPYRFVYAGSVNQEHGLCDFINEMGDCIQELVVIGDGEEWDLVPKICRRKGIRLKAYRNLSHKSTLKYLQDFDGFGLAPYTKNREYTYFCSPLKVFEYISSGIPVVMSDLPEIAGFVRQEELGVVFSELRKDELWPEINSFNTTDYCLRARNFYQAFRRDKLFQKLNLRLCQ